MELCSDDTLSSSSEALNRQVLQINLLFVNDAQSIYVQRQNWHLVTLTLNFLSLFCLQSVRCKINFLPITSQSASIDAIFSCACSFCSLACHINHIFSFRYIWNYMLHQINLKSKIYEVNKFA